MSGKLPHEHSISDTNDQILEIIGHTADFNSAAELFKQLGDPTRLRMFCLLCHNEECVINISAALGISAPAASHHIKALKSCGLITSRRDGKEVFYKSADTIQAKSLHDAMDHVMKFACPNGSIHCAVKRTDKGSFLCRGIYANSQLTRYRACQIENIREVHSFLEANLSNRVTIDELSKRFLMNPTTLKEIFKAVYGESIAAHMKEHRMQYALHMLRTTEKTFAEISHDIGYESQSKFSKAFKEYFGILPKDYRKIQDSESECSGYDDI